MRTKQRRRAAVPSGDAPANDIKKKTKGRAKYKDEIPKDIDDLLDDPNDIEEPKHVIPPSDREVEISEKKIQTVKAINKINKGVDESGEKKPQKGKKKKLMVEKVEILHVKQKKAKVKKEKKKAKVEAEAEVTVDVTEKEAELSPGSVVKEKVETTGTEDVAPPVTAILEEHELSSRSSSHDVSEASCRLFAVEKTCAQQYMEEAQRRLMLLQRFRSRWPEIKLPKIHTKPWKPPGPPTRPPPVEVKIPPVKTAEWVPPHTLPRAPRPPRPHIPPEQMTQLYEGNKLKRIWHNFTLLDKTKMILQGRVACNVKKRSSYSGAQTACIAVMCRALNEEKPASELTARDVDDTITTGYKYYRQCMLGLKCYQGKPQLELKQLIPSFYFRDAKYTIKFGEGLQVPLAKKPDDVTDAPDLMAVMGQRQGSKFFTILSLRDQHFLVWSPEERPVCYILDPHMLNEVGQPFNRNACERHRGGAILRYASTGPLVLEFMANYGALDPRCPAPVVTLTNIEVEQREPLARRPPYELDLKALPAHCGSEWTSLHKNVLIEQKQKERKYATASLSAVSVATSRAHPAEKIKVFYHKEEVKPVPVPPVPPELTAVRAPAAEREAPQLGEGHFFHKIPRRDCHAYGRDDMLPLPKSETKLHSLVDIANKNFHSQYHQLDAERWILRGTRHMASKRYYTFKWYTGVACCVAALGMLRRLRARAWNEDTVDETLDAGWNFFRESLAARHGPVRRLVLGELKDSFAIRDKEYRHKMTNVVVWGRMVSTNPKVFDLCRGVEDFFRTNDAGVLQVPGEYETAIWNEGGFYYLYHPWPADNHGFRVSLQGGGKACLLSFKRISSLCDYFMESARAFRRKPYSISAVYAWERPPMPEPVNQLKPVAPNRWVVRGGFHEGDTRFPEEHRNKQATPTSIAAIAYAHVVPPAEWDKDDVNESLIKGDQLYESTMEHLEKMGISLDKPDPGEEEEEPEASAPESLEPYSGMLAAGEVVDRFRITDEDCIVTEVLDGAYNGSLFPTDPDVLSLKQSLRELFKEHSHAVLTAHGRSVAVWKEDKNMYLFDPHGCDENGYPSEEPLAAACLIRLGGSVEELVKAIESNLPAGSDNTFNLSPVTVLKAKLNPELGAPEAKVESKAFEWIKRGTAAIMPGPRGETSAAGKIAQKAGIGDEDKAGRTLALPAIAAFAAAADAVPPPHMHQDHMYNFLDAGADYYLEHLKNTGNKEIGIEDLSKKFELGANTFSIELEEAYFKRLPLRQPDEMPPAEGAEFVEPGEEVIEGHTEMKELLTSMWNDQSKPSQTALLVGDYHQLGVWMSAGGLLVVYDPAPLLHRGMLTEHRIQKGDELRLKRIEDESEQPEDGELGADEAGGEEVPEPEPVVTPVPSDATPALMVFASPAEFIDKLVHQAPLNNMQMIAPYKLYLVKVNNELTAMYKDRRPVPKPATPAPRGGQTMVDPEEEQVEQEEEIILVEALEESALGKYMTRAGRAVASVRGRVAQREDYFMEPQRDHQDAAISVMAIIVDSIEPYVHWRAELIDSIVMYGDRLYTISLPGAKRKPRVAASECADNMHLSCFNVKLETETDVVTGDAKAPDAGELLNLPRGITAFLENHKYGVLCSKEYCVAIWRGLDEKSLCMFDPHCVGPDGRMSPIGGAGLVLFSCAEELAAAFKANVDILDRPGNAKYYITAVNVEWQYSGQPGLVPPASAASVVPDEGYEFKVLTAFSEIARDRTILRGSRPDDLPRFKCEAQLQSAAGAIVGACMSRVRQPHLWTRKTVDQVMTASNELFIQSISKLGYEFRPDDDLLLPLQVRQRFQLGTTYVRFDLHELYTGRLDPVKPDDVIFVAAIERFFSRNTHGILWVAPHAVAVWRTRAAPQYYMFEPHACGPSGFRIDGQENGAACVLTFSTPKLLAFSILQNYPREERKKTIFHLYGMTIDVAPIRKLEGGDPPLVKAPPGANLVPATSKVGVDGRPRSASEKDRRHPPGEQLCPDMMRAIDARDKDEERLRGRRNANGWLVLQDGSQYVSAKHSMACRKFTRGSRGNQALACCVMAVAMSRVQDVCRWCAPTLDAVLLSGDQLYQDSYLHYRPSGRLLAMDQILRKFYTPGNCVCSVLVYQPRQTGFVHKNLVEKLTEFFNEEKCGVFEAGVGAFAVALFRTARGFYMFDPADRDRYGRAVPPPCVGHARACLSQYRTVQSLAEKLAPNIPPFVGEPNEDEKSRTSKPGEPSATDQPAVGEKPSSGEKPSRGEKPSSSEKPSSGEKRTSVEKPSSGEKPATEAKRLSAEKHASGEKPSEPGSPSKSLIEIKKPESSVQKKLSPIMETGVTKEAQSSSVNLPAEKSEKIETSATGTHLEPKGVRFQDTEFRIYGMEVSSLRKTHTA